MAEILQTRDVLPMLAKRGLRVSRESLAEMSDDLGLQARAAEANWSHRRWVPAEVELITVAFELRRRWGFPAEVLQELLADGAVCAERIVERLQGALDAFITQAAVATDRVTGQLPPAADTAAA